MSTNEKVPNNAVCEPAGNSAIPDAIDMNNVEVIRRSAIELNHRARLGMAIITPFGMKDALNSFCDDVMRLCCRANGLRVVNAGSRDPIAEQAALDRQRKIRHEEIAKQFSETLVAFTQVLDKILAKPGPGTKNILQKQVFQPMEKAPNVAAATSGNKRSTGAAKAAYKTASSKRSA